MESDDWQLAEIGTIVANIDHPQQSDYILTRPRDETSATIQSQPTIANETELHPLAIDTNIIELYFPIILLDYWEIHEWRLIVFGVIFTK